MLSCKYRCMDVRFTHLNQPATTSGLVGGRDLTVSHGDRHAREGGGCADEKHYGEHASTYLSLHILPKIKKHIICVRLVRISPFPSCNQLTPNTDFPRNFPMKCSAPGSSLAVLRVYAFSTSCKPLIWPAFAWCKRKGARTMLSYGGL